MPGHDRLTDDAEASRPARAGDAHAVTDRDVGRGASVSAPSATSSVGRRRTAVDDRSGRSAPAAARSPTPSPAGRRSSPRSMQIDATSARTGSCVSRVVIGPQSLSGGAAFRSPAVVSHVQPYALGVETRWSRLAPNTSTRHDHEHAEDRTHQRRAHRQRGPRAALVERELHADRERRRGAEIAMPSPRRGPDAAARAGRARSGHARRSQRTRATSAATRGSRARRARARRRRRARPGSGSASARPRSGTAATRAARRRRRAPRHRPPPGRRRRRRRAPVRRGRSPRLRNVNWSPSTSAISRESAIPTPTSPITAATTAAM